MYPFKVTIIPRPHNAIKMLLKNHRYMVIMLHGQFASSVSAEKLVRISQE